MAVFSNTTLFAVRLAGGADISSVEYEPVVGYGDFLLGDMFHEFLLGL